jgi:hypothetical protein
MDTVSYLFIRLTRMVYYLALIETVMQDMFHAAFGEELADPVSIPLGVQRRSQGPVRILT